MLASWVVRWWRTIVSRGFDSWMEATVTVIVTVTVTLCVLLYWGGAPFFFGGAAVVVVHWHGGR